MTTSLLGSSFSDLPARPIATQRVRNGLLASLPAAELEMLAPALERVTLAAGDVLMSTGSAMRWVVFPETAVAALRVDAGTRHRRAEVTTVGSEGMIGFPQALLDAPSDMEAVVRVAGEGWRLHGGAFRALLGELPSLRPALDRYASALVLQLSLTALCARTHSIEQRLAALLLLMHDRTRQAELPLTHEQLAVMLGVRRAGVTEVATRLRSRSAISYRRGRVGMDDRAALLEASCSCYAATRSAFDRAASRDGAAD